MWLVYAPVHQPTLLAHEYRFFDWVAGLLVRCVLSLVPHRLRCELSLFRQVLANEGGCDLTVFYKNPTHSKLWGTELITYNLILLK
jgi:hypothetical protein